MDASRVRGEIKMPVETGSIKISTKGGYDVIDITGKLNEFVMKTGISDGIAHVFCAGSTGGLTTTEYEPGAVRDMKEFLELSIPPTPPGPAWGEYFHHETWHDDNGHSHLRSSLIGPQFTVPVRIGQCRLGAWQQVVFMEFDTRPRQRELVVTVIGE